MFGFDEKYPAFDVTPVDNQFILEYLPGASENAVRVYLYGLMQCYHPQGMSIDQMGREIGLSRDEIMAAYRHWERKGLVRRIADEPPTYRYVSIKQLTMMGGAPIAVDEAYETFAAAVYGIFGSDRQISGKEMGHLYEWVEQEKLPMELVLHVISHCVRVNGAKISIKAIDETMMAVADEEIRTTEDADDFFNRERAILDGARAVLRRFGRRRNPTQDELGLYRTWRQDWAFTDEDIQAACAETTKGEPTFAYLGGILKRLNERRSGNVADQLAGEKEQSAPLKALLGVMHLPGVSVNDATLAAYEEMRELYPDSIILMAGQECARRGAAFEDVMTTLRIWKRAGLLTQADVRGYMQHIDQLNDFLRMLYDVLGVSARPNAPDRKLAAHWLEEFSFDAAFVLQCGAFAIGKEKPMAYLDAILDTFHTKGVRTMAAARQEREAFQAKAAASATVRGPKVVGEQQYTQREYAHSEDAMDAMMKQWQEENADA